MRGATPYAKTVSEIPNLPRLQLHAATGDEKNVYLQGFWHPRGKIAFRVLHSGGCTSPRLHVIFAMSVNISLSFKFNQPIVSYLRHYCRCQVVKKQIPADLVMESDTMAVNWVHDRLERQASYMLGQALCGQLELLTGRRMDFWRLPAGITVRRLTASEQRVKMPSGEFSIVDVEGGTAVIQLPLAALRFNFPILNQLADRGPVNSGLLHFMQHDGLLTTFTFGPFHGLWNSVKNSLKQACHGRPWQCILGYTILNNLNYYPFKSNQAYRLKRTTLREYLMTHDSSSPSFQAIAQDFSRSTGLPCNTPEEQNQLFQALGSMRSFDQRGPLLKLSRWMSISDCWRFMNPELPGLWLLLGEAMKHVDTIGADAQDEPPDTESAAVEPEKVQAELRKSGGHFEKARAWVTPYNIFMMEMIDMTTKCLQEAYSHRASRVKNVDEGLSFEIERVERGIFGELLPLAQNCFYHKDRLRDLFYDENRTDWLQEMIDFVFRLMYHRAEAVLPELEAYPGMSVLGLHPDPVCRSRARKQMLKHLHVLLEAEELGHVHAGLESIYKAVPWRANTVVRLLLFVNEMEACDPYGERTQYILEAMHKKIRTRKLRRIYTSTSATNVAVAGIHRQGRSGFSGQSSRQTCPSNGVSTALASASRNCAKSHGTMRVSRRCGTGS